MFRTLTLSLGLLFSPLSLAAPAEAAGLRVEQPYSFPTPAPGITAGGFLTIVNPGAADRLLAVESPWAERVEIHEMSMDGGVMRMRALPDGLVVPAGATLSLAPGGYHLMLIAPRQALAVDQRVPLSLVFERAGRIEAELRVRPRKVEDAHAHH